MLNQWVFCTLKDEGALGCFTVVPPAEGEYHLKIYAHPESEVVDDDAKLDHVASFILIAEKV